VYTHATDESKKQATAYVPADERDGVNDAGNEPVGCQNLSPFSFVF
jgi:hypothetical protein